MRASASHPPTKPLPRINGPERHFWEGLREREIRVQECLSCGRARFPASRYCSRCHSDQFTWAAVDPTGEVESFCVFYKAYFPSFASELPYAVIQVKLKSGVRFFSNIVGVTKDNIRIGMHVTAVFDDVTPSLTLLKFRPSEN